MLPRALFSGPDVAGNTEWALNFAKAESGDLQLLTHHYYRTGAKRPEATVETLLAPHAAWENTLRTLQEGCAVKGISFRINEVNSFYGGGKAGVSDTFASALWDLDFMFLLAAHGCEGINLETDINQLAWVSHYSPIYRDAAGHLSARPEYYGMLAFSLAGKGNLVKLTSTKTDVNVRAYATKDRDGLLWVTILNKDLLHDITVEIALPAGHFKAEAYRLRAPSAESRSQVTLAGAEVSADGKWSPAAVENVPVTKGVALLALPTVSAALVRLP